jgi:hypothetical protein
MVLVMHENYSQLSCIYFPGLSSHLVQRGTPGFMAPELLGVEDEGQQEQASMTGKATSPNLPCHIFAGPVTLNNKDSNRCSTGFQDLYCRYLFK